MIDDELQRMLALDSAPGPALAIDAAHADAIVDAALAGAGFGPGGGGTDGGGNGGGGNGHHASGPGRAIGSASPGGPSSAAGGTMAAGTKLVIVAGAALAVVVIALFALRGRGRGSEQLATPTVDAAVDSAVTGTGTGARSQAGPSDEPVTVDPSPDDPSPNDPSPVDPVPDDPPRDDASADPPRRAKPSRDPSPADEAADLLGEANAKRGAKQWRKADALYTRVVRLAPKSLAAQTALVASASLHLEHLGDPKGAAQRFRRALALAPSGALAEDARWGLAEAARARKDRAGEAAALDDFLAHHPRSPLASRAKARRAELP